jgi:hypothetical protein
MRRRARTSRFALVRWCVTGCGSRRLAAAALVTVPWLGLLACGGDDHGTCTEHFSDSTGAALAFCHDDHPYTESECKGLSTQSDQHTFSTMSCADQGYTLHCDSVQAEYWTTNQQGCRF